MEKACCRWVWSEVGVVLNTSKTYLRGTKGGILKVGKQTMSGGCRYWKEEYNPASAINQTANRCPTVQSNATESNVMKVEEKVEDEISPGCKSRTSITRREWGMVILPLLPSHSAAIYL